VTPDWYVHGGANKKPPLKNLTLIVQLTKLTELPWGLRKVMETSGLLVFEHGTS